MYYSRFMWGTYVNSRMTDRMKALQFEIVHGSVFYPKTSISLNLPIVNVLKCMYYVG